MAGWLLGIVGVVALGVLLDIMLPNGDINKYIKGIFGIVVVFVIVAPLPKLIKGEFTDFLKFSDTVEIDNNYVNSVNDSRNKDREKSLKKVLNDSGHSVNRVSIDYSKDNFYDIEKVKVYVGANTAADQVKAKVAECLKIKQEEIKVYAG